MVYRKAGIKPGIFSAVLIPGFVGALVEIFFFSVLPAIFSYSVHGTSISKAVPNGIAKGFKPFLDQFSAPSIDYALLAGPAIGFVVGILFWMMYQNDEM